MPAIPPANKSNRWRQVWSNESVSLGLAVLSGTPRKDLPENATTWLNTAISPGEHLMVLDDLSRCWQDGEMAAWVQQVQMLNHEWVMPLLNALRRKEIDELDLYACNGRKFTLSRAGSRRWWRRKKPLAVIAAHA